MGKIKSPEQRVAAASQRVSKAVSIFTGAIDELEGAVVDHELAGTAYLVEAAELRDQAAEAYSRALSRSLEEYRASMGKVDQTDALAVDAYNMAEAARDQADHLRSVLGLGVDVRKGGGVAHG